MKKQYTKKKNFFFQAEDGIRDGRVTGVQTCALPILPARHPHRAQLADRDARPAAFLVDGSWPGISVRKLRTMGMPGWQLGAPRFEDVEVPAENMLGGEGRSEERRVGKEGRTGGWAGH